MKRRQIIAFDLSILLAALIIAAGSLLLQSASPAIAAGDRLQQNKTTPRAESERDYVRPEWFLTESHETQVADWGPAIKAATHFVSALGGGSVKYSCGKSYRVTKPLDLDFGAAGRMLGSVRWEGCATDYEYQSMAPTIEYTGAGTEAAFSMRSSYGFRMDGMKIQYTNPAFRGKLFDFSHSEAARGGNNGDSAYLTIENSTLTGTEMASEAEALLYVGNAIISRIDTNHFFYAHTGILGMEAGNSSYAYVFTVARNSFNSVDRAIVNPSSNWIIENNTFEPNKYGQLVAVENDCGAACTQASGIRFSNNYLGDGIAQRHPMVRFVKADGLTISGNWWYSDTEISRAAITLDNCEGVVVSGNSARSVETFIELAGGTTFGLTTISNKINSPSIVTESGATCTGCNILEPSRSGTAPAMTKLSSLMASGYAAEGESVFDLSFGGKWDARKFKNGGVYSVMDNAYGLMNGAVGISAGDNYDAPVFFATDNKVRATINGSGFASRVPVTVPGDKYDFEKWKHSNEVPTKAAIAEAHRAIVAEIRTLLASQDRQAAP
jgi:hypothetical protein